MKTVALSWRISLIALTGSTLIVGAAAASDPNTPSAQAPPVTNTSKAPGAMKDGTELTPKEVRQQGEAGGGTAVSSQIAEIVKMTESGVGANVIQAHVQQSATIYPPNADEIIYLHDHGVPADVITAFIRRGSELRAQAEQAAREGLTRAAQPAPPTTAPATASVQPPAYAYPAQPEYPVYPYTYPDYVYWGYPGYSYVWPSYWWWSAGYYPRHFVGYHHPYPTHYYHGPVRPYPHSFAGSGRSPWVSPVRSGFGSAPHSGYATRAAPGGHFGGGFSGSRSHR